MGRGKEKGEAKTPSTQEKRSCREKNPPPIKREPCGELNHTLGEEIYAAKFPFREIVPAFSDDPFNPHLKNGATRTRFESSHHVKGEGPKSKQDFLEFRCCFCLEWIKIMIEGQPYWVRCLNMFNYKSPGCSDHPKVQFKDGPNSIYSLMRANRVGTWRILRNTQAEQEEIPFTVKQQRAKAQAEAEAVAERIAATYLEGKSTKALEAEHKQQLKNLSRIPKDLPLPGRGMAAVPQALGSKATPSNTTDGLRLHGGPTGVYNGRRKAGESAPGVPNLDLKSKSNPNMKPRAQAQINRLTIATQAESEAQRNKPKCKGQNQAGIGGSSNGLQ